MAPSNPPGKTPGLSGFLSKRMTRQLVPLAVIIGILGSGYVYYIRYSAIHFEARVDRGYRVLDQTVDELNGRLASLGTVLSKNFENSPDDNCQAIDIEVRKLEADEKATNKLVLALSDTYPRVLASQKKLVEEQQAIQDLISDARSTVEQARTEHSDLGRDLDLSHRALKEAIRGGIHAGYVTDPLENFDIAADATLVDVIAGLQKTEETLRIKIEALKTKLAGLEVDAASQPDRAETMHDSNGTDAPTDANGHQPSVEHATGKISSASPDPVQIEARREFLEVSIEQSRQELDERTDFRERLSTSHAAVRIRKAAFDKVGDELEAAENSLTLRREELAVVESKPNPKAAYEESIKLKKARISEISSAIERAKTERAGCEKISIESRFVELAKSLTRLRDYAGLRWYDESEPIRGTAPETGPPPSPDRDGTWVRIDQTNADPRVGVILVKEANTFHLELPASSLLDRDSLASAFDSILLVSPSRHVIAAQPLARSLYGPAAIDPGIPAPFYGKMLDVILAARKPEPVASDAEAKMASRYSLQDEISRDEGRVYLERTIGERQYSVFLQTFRFPFPLLTIDPVTKEAEVDSENVWTLVGLARTDRLKSEGSNFSLTVVLALLGVALLGVLSLPFLKVWFIGDLDRYRYADLLWLSLSALLATAIIAIVAIDIYRYQALLSELDTTAGLLADDLTTTFQRELHESVSVLEDRSATLPLGEFGPQCRSDADGPEWFGSGRRYPQFEVMFTASSAGEIVGCTNVRERSTSVNRGINVTDRQYFQRARDRSLWRLAPITRGEALVAPSCMESPLRGGTQASTELAHCGSRSFNLQSIRVWDQGAKMLALSIRLSNPPESSGPVVAAMLKRFLSVWVQPMAPGFGFVIVDDASGEVQAASIDKRILAENFYVEVGNNRALLGAIRGRQSWITSGTYQGRDHRFTTRPINGIPWTLVVFSDLSLPRAVNFEATVWAAGVFILLCSIAVIGVLILKLARPGFRGSWIWPSAEASRLYCAEIASQVLIIATGIVSACTFDTGPAVGVYLPLIIVQIGIHYLVACQGAAFKHGRRNAARAAVTIAYVLHLSLVYCAQSIVRVETDVEHLVVVLVVLESFLAGSLWRIMRVQSPNGADADPATLGARTIKMRFALVALLALVSAAALPAVLIHNDGFAAYYDAYRKFGLQQLGESVAQAQIAYFEDAQRINPVRAQEEISERAELRRGISAGFPGEVSTTCVMQPPFHDVTSAAWSNLFGIEQVRYECSGHALTHPIEQVAGGWDLRSVLGVPHARVGEIGACAPTEEVRKKYPWLRSQVAASTIWGEPGGFRRAVHPFVPDNGLGYASEAGMIRAFVGSAATDCSWSVGPEPAFYFQDLNGNVWLRAALRRNGFPAFEDQATANAVLLASSLLALGILYGMLYATSNRLFGLAFLGEVETPENLVHMGTKPVLIIGGDRKAVASYVQSFFGEKPPSAATLDLDWPPHAPGSTACPWWPTPDAKIQLIRGLETHHDVVDWCRAKLDLIERTLARDPGGPLIVSSEVHPVRWFDALEATLEVSDAADLQERWLNALSRMEVVVLGHTTTTSWMKEKDHASAFFVRECSSHPDLNDLLVLKDHEPPLTKLQLATIVDRKAEPIHRRTWSLATPVERVVMAHMALGGIPNAANQTILRELMRRGLVRRDPDFRLCSESFSKFVAHAESRETLDAWQREQGRDTWSVVRLPLLATLFVILAFVIATNGDQLKSTVTLLATGLGGIPVVLQLLNALRSGSSGGASS